MFLLNQNYSKLRFDSEAYNKHIIQVFRLTDYSIEDRRIRLVKFYKLNL